MKLDLSSFSFIFLSNFHEVVNFHEVECTGDCYHCKSEHAAIINIKKKCEIINSRNSKHKLHGKRGVTPHASQIKPNETKPRYSCIVLSFSSVEYIITFSQQALKLFQKGTFINI